jgi:hypothetical protein
MQTTKPPTWHTLPDFLIERFPSLRAELEEDYFFWAECGDPYPHFFLDDFLVPLLLGRHDATTSEMREEAGRVLDALLVAEDTDLAAAAQTSVFELLRDNPELRDAAWPCLGPIAREWLGRASEES